MRGGDGEVGCGTGRAGMEAIDLTCLMAAPLAVGLLMSGGKERGKKKKKIKKHVKKGVLIRGGVQE